MTASPAGVGRIETTFLSCTSTVLDHHAEGGQGREEVRPAVPTPPIAIRSRSRGGAGGGGPEAVRAGLRGPKFLRVRVSFHVLPRLSWLEFSAMLAAQRRDRHQGLGTDRASDFDPGGGGPPRTRRQLDRAGPPDDRGAGRPSGRHSQGGTGMTAAAAETTDLVR